MDDLISRQDALDILDGWKRTFKEMSHNQSAADIKLVKSEFAKLIPVKKSERKPGKWIPDNNNYYDERYICSQCGVSYKVDTRMGKPSWDFCPHCGARMEVE